MRHAVGQITATERPTQWSGDLDTAISAREAGWRFLSDTDSSRTPDSGKGIVMPTWTTTQSNFGNLSHSQNDWTGGHPVPSPTPELNVEQRT